MNVKPIDTVLQKIRDTALKAQECVRGLLGPDVTVDEVSLLFSSSDVLHHWLTALVREPGYELFNAAEDTVETRPIMSFYHVHYWFVRTPFPFRIEAMLLGPGFSPLHGSLEKTAEMAGDLPLLVHASFKCASEEQYATAQISMRDNDFDLAMSCSSDYGRFSYYTKEGLDFYLKPRLNMRDAS